MARKVKIKSHLREVKVSGDIEEHFRRPLFKRVRVKSHLRKIG